MKAVVLSDLRLFTIFAVIQIYTEANADCIVVSEEVIAAQEYGSRSREIIKRLKVWVMQKLYKVLIIKTVPVKESKDWPGINSSLISQTRDANATPGGYPDLAAHFRRQAEGAVCVFQSLKKRGAQEIFIYNGRFSSTQPICELAAKDGIKIWYYEWGWIPFHLTIAPVPMHDYVSQAKLAISIYKNQAVLPEIYAFGHQVPNVIDSKLNNTFAKTYSTEVKRDYDVSIFLGSPHELMAEPLNNIITNLEFCQASVGKYGKVHYAIRSHPNQTSDPSWPIQAAELEEFSKSIGADYYGPDSTIDSHQLIRRSALVVTYYSSIAVDAFFLGSKVDVIGDCIFKYFIEECADDDSTQAEKNHKMAMLLLIYKRLYQHPMHPRWTLLLKLFGWIDRRVVDYVHIRM